jgi:hypothetical protein
MNLRSPKRISRDNVKRESSGTLKIHDEHRLRNMIL